MLGEFLQRFERRRRLRKKARKEHLDQLDEPFLGCQQNLTQKRVLVRVESKGIRPRAAYRPGSASVAVGGSAR